MITARATGDDDSEIIILGITRENVRQLLEARPIFVDSETHPGFPEKLKIAIFFGENERACTDQLKIMIDPDHTKVIAVKPS